MARWAHQKSLGLEIRCQVSHALRACSAALRPSCDNGAVGTSEKSWFGHTLPGLSCLACMQRSIEAKQ
eukprot:1158344-Pelagomonas_calceolata.AAC.24